MDLPAPARRLGAHRARSSPAGGGRELSGGRKLRAPPRLPAAALVAALVVVAAGPATAAEVSRRRFDALVRDALEDRDALQRLKRVDAVEGEPFDARRALGSSDGEALERRLEALAGRDLDAAGGPGAGIDPSEARRESRSILEQERFRSGDLPRPFAGLVQGLGRLLEPVIEAIGDALRFVAGLIPGGMRTVWVILGIVIAAVAALVARSLIRRRGGRGEEGAERATRPERPSDLEAEAVEAERRGDLEAAIRLRFRAGLLRLHRAEVLSYSPSLTSREVSRRLRSRDFDEVATIFDLVVYGRRHAEREDADRSRAGWSRVLERAGRP